MTRAAAAVVLLGFGASGCWLQSGFDAGRDRYVAGAAPITTANADELVELWRATGLGGSVNEPLARGGDVYVTTTSGSAARLAAGTGAVGYDRTFTDPETGEAIGLAPPIFRDNEIVTGWTGARPIMGGTRTVGGVVRLAPGTGEPVVPLANEGNYAPIHFADDGTLATASMNRLLGILGDATVEWRGILAVDDPALNGLTPTDFAVAGDNLVWSDGVLAFGWHGTACTNPMTTLDGRAACASDWERSFAGVTSGPAAIGADKVAYGVANGSVVVLDAATGADGFTGLVPGGPVAVSAPAVAAGTILVGTADGRLVAFPAAGCGAATCTPLWQATVGAGMTSAPTVVDQVAYAVTGNGRLAAVALAGCGAATCAPLASYPVGPAAGPPIYDSGRIIVGTSDGQVAAFGLPPSP